MASATWDAYAGTSASTVGSDRPSTRSTAVVTNMPTVRSNASSSRPATGVPRSTSRTPASRITASANTSEAAGNGVTPWRSDTRSSARPASAPSRGNSSTVETSKETDVAVREARSALVPKIRQVPCTIATTARCGMETPFGTPVEPDV